MFFLLFNFTLLTNPLSGSLRRSASASVHWKTSFVCIYVFLCCLFWTVDTKVVLTAAILFSRYSPLNHDRVGTSHQTLTMVLYSPRQQPLQWRLCSSSHITSQSGNSSDLNSSSLRLSAYRQYLRSCLLSHVLSLPLCLYQSSLPLSVSPLSSCLWFAISQWPFSSQQFKLRKKEKKSSECST